MSKQDPIEDELPAPRIPSVNDPFNLKDCDQYPNPLSASEDIILKHILGICSSDYQMSKRAYDSIVCMWAKNIASRPPPNELVAPVLTSVSPTIINIPDTEFDSGQTLLTLKGSNIQPGAKILINGFEATSVTFTPPDTLTGIYQHHNPPYILTTNVGVTILNPDNKLSNSVSIQTKNPFQTDPPVITSISPTTMTGNSTTGFSQTLTVNGSNFSANTYMYLYVGGRRYSLNTSFGTSTQIQWWVNIPPFINGSKISVGVQNYSGRYAHGPEITLIAS